MKKLMFIAAAALCGTVMADDAITSANIVGYMTCTRPQVNFCGGSMFNNVGSEGITLADLKITGPLVTAKAAWRNCAIQFFKTGNTAVLDSNAKYWMDWDGKWRKFVNGGNFNTDPVLTAEQIAAVDINPGEGFLCQFNNANAKVTYAGEVITGDSKKLAIPRPQVNFVVVNPSANNIDLSQITITGPLVTAKAAWRNCAIQFFKSGNTAVLDSNAKYWMDWDGKWRKFVNGGNFNTDPVLTAEQKAAVVIKPGEGFLCQFNNASAVISMPTSL